ncbi:hypothetical protein KP509_19G009200 [Ceratopteris richardii]|uniref:Homeobox domain-containing protein n=1 Tax=Ceratopteris richardii TaxID=49495 RepID=A0A8T2SHQ6_CERRI|nr:hypothetical protein KP509_19G009200 [Ceratopteris richardii]
MYPGDQHDGDDYRVSFTPMNAAHRHSDSTATCPHTETVGRLDASLMQPALGTEPSVNYTYPQTSRRYFHQHYELGEQQKPPHFLQVQSTLPGQYITANVGRAPSWSQSSSQERANIDERMWKETKPVGPVMISRDEVQLLFGRASSNRSTHLGGVNVMDPERYLDDRVQDVRIDEPGALKSRNVHFLGKATSGNVGCASADVPSDRTFPAAATRICTQEGCGVPRPRWNPTQEQIQILETIFNSGTTTPSRDMIVDIAAQLRAYGNIGEANVFYWFQNRKARAKRKLQPAASPSSQASSHKSA